MKIHTDRLRHTVITGKLIDQQINASYELRILAVLKYLFPVKYALLFRKDSPDLQDKTNSIGIEVTVVVCPDEMQANSEFSKLCNYNDLEGANKLRIIEKNGNKVIQKGNVLILDFPLSSAQKEKNFNDGTNQDN